MEGALVVDERRDSLCEWLNSATPYRNCPLELASADASFRRYFRISTPDGTRVVMDAPPHLEPCDFFVRLAREMGQKGIPVPKVYYQNLELGFLVLTDFGDVHFQDALQDLGRNQLYTLAIEQILGFQKHLNLLTPSLPRFDLAWQAKELEIFREWCLPDVSPEDFATLVSPLTRLIDQIPKSFMHRDFHCRNLLITGDKSLGIIDFQGAMLGPITYDLVSLLRDCYVDHADEWAVQQVMHFRTQLIKSGLLAPQTDEFTLQKWFDWSGLQRHLKCVGIFHRLNLRDGKPQYLKDIPRVLGYIKLVLQAYPELSDLHSIVEQAKITP